MISWLVRRMVERGYGQLNAFDLDALMKAFAPDAVFEFMGESPFGGERRGREAIRGWFEQVGRELGRLHLTAHDVAVSGPPWNMVVIIRLTDRYHLITGDTLENRGFQYVRLSWGKVKEDRVLADLTVLQRALDLISAGRPADGDRAGTTPA